MSKEYYSNQFYGAIDWITRSGPNLIQRFTDTSLACDEKSRRKLWRVGYGLLMLWAFRYPAVYVESRFRKKKRLLHDYFFLMLALPFYLFAKPLDLYFKYKALDEWRQRKSHRNGSEMYLYFIKNSGEIQR